MRILRLCEDTQHGSYSVGNKSRVRDSTEINVEVNSIVELVEQGVGDGDGHGRLAHAARAHHAYEAPRGGVTPPDKAVTTLSRPIMRAKRGGSLCSGSKEGSGRKQKRHRPLRRRVTNRRDETITPPRYVRDVSAAVLAIAQHLPQIRDRYPETALAYYDVGPCSGYQSARCPTTSPATSASAMENIERPAADVDLFSSPLNKRRCAGIRRYGPNEMMSPAAMEPRQKNNCSLLVRPIQPLAVSV